MQIKIIIELKDGKLHKVWTEDPEAAVGVIDWEGAGDDPVKKRNCERMTKFVTTFKLKEVWA